MPESNFTSYGQVGQDLFVYEQLVKPFNHTSGTFLDIGCNHPFDASNSVALEKLGWKGILVDINPVMVELCRKNRSNPVIESDATKLNWSVLCAEHGIGKVIDYLSLDLDDCLGEESKVMFVLKSLLSSGFSFHIATIEHDGYRLGNEIRDALRGVMLTNGYTRFMPDPKTFDVAHIDMFEDWWVNPNWTKS